MLKLRNVEIMVGVFVVLGIAALFMLAMRVSNLSSFSTQDGYHLTARFQNIGGLKVLSPISMSGVRIGRVAAIRYDQQHYEAEVEMVVDKSYNRIPSDSSASIFTSGLLGEQYISIDPGGEEQYLKDGDHIRMTQSALVLEQMIGQFLFGKASGGGTQ